MATITPPPAPPVAAEALRSVHTTNLPALFAQLQISLLVTTYQAGKVIVVRNDGRALHTYALPWAWAASLSVLRAVSRQEVLAGALSGSPLRAGVSRALRVRRRR